MQLPALRERRGDATLIAEHLLAQYSDEENKNFKSFDIESRKIIEGYNWPGNIRELQNVVRQVVVLNDGDEITASMWPIHLQPDTKINTNNDEVTSEYTESSKDVLKPLWQIEQEHIDRVVAHCNDNIPKAATILEVSPSTLYRKQAKR